jgi:mono/diheme cytochrome c family protein
MKQSPGTLTVLVVILLGCLVTAMYMFSQGFSAKEEPPRLEAFIARRLRRLAIPAGARQLTNPEKASPEVMAHAMEHFADHCAVCHGNDGRGMTLIGRGLYPKPPDMTGRATQELSDGELYYIIENGIRFTGMPGFAEEPGNNEDNETWDLVHFIRHLPNTTDDEIAQMKKMNPKSPMELEREERMRKFLQGEDTPPAENDHEHHH